MLTEIKNFIVENPRLFFGNLVGFISAIFSFLSYQAKTPKKLLTLQYCVSGAAAVSFAILGAWSGMAMNIVCLIRNYTFDIRNRKPFSSPSWPYIIAVITGAVGALSWQGPISLLIIIPIMINTVVLSLADNTKLRLSILFTSSVIIIYDLYSKAYFSAITETVTITSAAIGLIRYRKKE